MSTVIHQSINCEYEYIQYNKQLRIIHSIDDDMYHMKSIIDACHSKKQASDWFRNRDTQELLKSFEHDRDLAGSIPYDNRIKFTEWNSLSFEILFSIDSLSDDLFMNL